jgi:hypothetical protein
MRIRTLSMPTANTEYSITIPAECVYFSIQARGSNNIRFAFETGKVAGSVEPYATLKSGAGFDTGAIDRALRPGNPTILYVASNDSSVVLELFERF